MATKKKSAAKSKTARKSVNESLSLADISPSFTVNDVEASVAWYRDVLGFKLGERWEHEGKLMGAMMAAGKTATLMLGQDDWKKGRDRVKGVGVRM